MTNALLQSAIPSHDCSSGVTCGLSIIISNGRTASIPLVGFRPSPEVRAGDFKFGSKINLEIFNQNCVPTGVTEPASPKHLVNRGEEAPLPLC